MNLGAAGGEELLVIVFAGLVGGILWNLTTWLVALPSSSSHALFGGLIGASLGALGTSGVEWGGVLGKIVAPALISPVVAALVSAVGARAIFRITATVPEQSTESGFRWAQTGSVSPDDEMPTWVKIACTLAIALGTYFEGWRVIRTLGKGLVDISARQGVAAESASAAIILTSSHLGLPLSTTHVATGSILGSGLGRSGAEVRWQVARRMALAWVVTLPAAAVVGAGCWALADLIGGAAGVGTVFALLVAMSTTMWFRSRRTPVGADNVNAAWPDTTEGESVEPPLLPPVREPSSSIEPTPPDLPGKDIRPVRFGRRTSRPVR